MATRYYVGIGTPSTPGVVLDLMARFAHCLANQDLRVSRDTWILRSGHTPGADQAFERGAAGQAEIHLPYVEFDSDVELTGRVLYRSPNERAVERARNTVRPAEEVDEHELMFRARDIQEVLGYGMAQPADLVVCWTPDGSLDGEGSTAGRVAHALRVAAEHDVPVLNLARPDHRGLVAAIAQGVLPADQLPTAAATFSQSLA